MLQIKKRKDGNKSKFRFMPTICFYQDSRHEESLYWIREELGIGYLSKRKDGMTELRINGYEQIMNILLTLIPYIKFKKIQANALKEACAILLNTKLKMLKDVQLVKLVDLILLIQKENYVTKKKKTKDELLLMLGLTP